ITFNLSDGDSTDSNQTSTQPRTQPSSLPSKCQAEQAHQTKMERVLATPVELQHLIARSSQ
ncbi:26085_t:CDS:1, partial [Gigaspora margarita]